MLARHLARIVVLLPPLSSAHEALELAEAHAGLMSARMRGIGGGPRLELNSTCVDLHGVDKRGRICGQFAVKRPCNPTRRHVKGENDTGEVNGRIFWECKRQNLPRGRGIRSVGLDFKLIRIEIFHSSNRHANAWRQHFETAFHGLFFVVDVRSKKILDVSIIFTRLVDDWREWSVDAVAEEWGHGTCPNAVPW